MELLDGRGQIKYGIIEDLLVEVACGKSIFTSGTDLYASRSPTMDEQDKARIVYTRRLHDCKARGLPTREQMESCALARGIFEVRDREEAKALDALMSRQVKARENTRDPQQKIELAAAMEETQARLTALRMAEEEVFYYSAEAKAEDFRTCYMVSCCTLTGELLDQPLWATWETFRECRATPLIADARMAFLRAWNGLPIKIIRAITRTSEWRARWKAACETGAPIFDGLPTEWDANKRNLVWWSDFYDSVRRHPECPSEEVIANDDTLQDWMNQQIAKTRPAAKAAAPSHPQRTVLMGDGRRVPMVAIGQNTIHVDQPYKVRV